MKRAMYLVTAGLMLTAAFLLGRQIGNKQGSSRTYMMIQQAYYEGVRDARAENVLENN